MTDITDGAAQPVFLLPKDGRTYPCGGMTAIFKADGGETGNRYCVSEWWVEPGAPGPGAHLHEANDELFYVIEGVASLLVGEEWVTAPKGSFLLIPAGTMHDFENRSTTPMGLFNVFIPGDFEKHMPAIVDWFKNVPST